MELSAPVAHSQDTRHRLAPRPCSNCGAHALTGAFCHECGQKVEGKLSFRAVAAGLKSQFVNLDFALLRTFAELTLHPGRVARLYVVGRRRAYSNPITYAFLTATVYAVVLSFVEFDPQAQAASFTKFILRLGSLVPYLILLVLIPMAALQRWLMRRPSSYNAAECYVFLLYTYAQLFIMSTIVVLLGVYDTWAGLAFGGILAIGFLGWGLMEFHVVRPLVALATAVLVFALSELLGTGLGIGWLVVTSVWR